MNQNTPALTAEKGDLISDFQHLFVQITEFEKDGSGAASAPLSVDQMRTNHSRILSESGLSLDTDGSGGKTRIKLSITNWENYSRFLNGISPQTVIEKDLAPKLEAIVSDLTSRVRLLTDTNNLEKHLNLFATVSTTLRHFERLGVMDRCKKLSEYFFQAKEGTLPNFIKVEDQGLLIAPNQDSSPSFWHRGVGPMEFNDRWKNALATLNELQANEKTSALAAQVAENLERCAAKAFEDSPNFNFRYVTEFKKTLRLSYPPLLRNALAIDRALPENGDRLRDSLQILLKNTNPGLMAAGNVYYKTIMLEGSICFAVHHSRTAQLIGFIAAIGSVKPEEAEISYLVVSPEYREMGVEQALLEAIEKVLEARGYKTMRFDLSPEDAASLLQSYSHRAETGPLVKRAMTDSRTIKIGLSHPAFSQRQCGIFE